LHKNVAYSDTARGYKTLNEHHSDSYINIFGKHQPHITTTHDYHGDKENKFPTISVC